MSGKLYWWDTLNPTTRFSKSNSKAIKGNCYRCGRISENRVVLDGKNKNVFPAWIVICQEHCYPLQREDGSFPQLSPEERAWLSLCRR